VTQRLTDGGLCPANNSALALRRVKSGGAFRFSAQRSFGQRNANASRYRPNLGVWVRRADYPGDNLPEGLSVGR
jgi:hypothetical protein